MRFAPATIKETYSTWPTDERPAVVTALATRSPVASLPGPCQGRPQSGVAARIGRLDIVDAVAEVSGHLISGTPKAHQPHSVVSGFLRDEFAARPAGRDPEKLALTSSRSQGQIAR